MKIKYFDFMIIVFFCFVSALLWGAKFIAKTEPTSAVIYYNQEKYTYDLNENQVLSIDSSGIHLTVRIEQGRVCVEEAWCPDQTCKKTGWIDKAGECIVCIPAGILIEIQQEKEAEYDALSG
ncbi:MAG: NusG domain II-containing protein [Clostridiales bacterium]|nr:NusG domain II-containing protein [Clostridiales bacterium]